MGFGINYIFDCHCICDIFISKFLLVAAKVGNCQGAVELQVLGLKSAGILQHKVTADPLHQPGSHRITGQFRLGGASGGSSPISHSKQGHLGDQNRLLRS